MRLLPLVCRALVPGAALLALPARAAAVDLTFGSPVDVSLLVGSGPMTSTVGDISPTLVTGADGVWIAWIRINGPCHTGGSSAAVFAHISDASGAPMFTPSMFMSDPGGPFAHLIHVSLGADDVRAPVAVVTSAAGACDATGGGSNGIGVVDLSAPTVGSTSIVSASWDSFSVTTPIRMARLPQRLRTTTGGTELAIGIVTGAFGATGESVYLDATVTRPLAGGTGIAFVNFDGVPADFVRGAYHPATGHTNFFAFDNSTANFSIEDVSGSSGSSTGSGTFTGNVDPGVARFGDSGLFVAENGTQSQPVGSLNCSTFNGSGSATDVNCDPFVFGPSGLAATHDPLPLVTWIAGTEGTGDRVSVERVDQSGTNPNAVGLGATGPVFGLMPRCHEPTITMVGSTDAVVAASCCLPLPTPDGGVDCSASHIVVWSVTVTNIVSADAGVVDGGTPDATLGDAIAVEASMVDSGVASDGTTTRDASVGDAAMDVAASADSAPSGTVDSGPSVGFTGGACQCRAPARGAGRSDALGWLALGAIGVVVRRRRRA